MAASLGHKAAVGAIWSTVDRFGYMALQFIVNLVLARLLMPSDFGIIGMLSVFMAVSQVLIDGGFGSALIQKKEPTQQDYSTIFYWNLGLSCLLYLILFLISPWVGVFFHMPLLSKVLRVIGLSLIISSVYTIQTTKLKKSLAFKHLSIANLAAYAVASGIAIVLAYHQWGVWSLVAVQLLYPTVGIIVLAFITKWCPSLYFSKTILKELFGFGVYMMAANILQEVSRNIQGLIIGRKFSATQMGFYSQAHKFDAVTSNTLPQVIGQVMYPAFSSLQSEHERLRLALSKSVILISMLTFPLLGLLILEAAPLIGFLYGDKWLPCVGYYQNFCVGGIFTCLININFYVVAALGHSKLLFKWSIYKWSFLLGAVLIGMNFGVSGIVWGVVASNANTYLVNSILANRKLHQSIFVQIGQIGRILVCVALSLLLAYCFSIVVTDNDILAGLVFVTVYAISSWILNKDYVDTVCEMIKLIKK